MEHGKHLIIVKFKNQFKLHNEVKKCRKKSLKYIKWIPEDVGVHAAHRTARQRGFFFNFTCKVHLNSTETGVHGSIEEASGHHFKDFRRFGEQLYLYCKLLHVVH